MRLKLRRASDLPQNPLTINEREIPRPTARPKHSFIESDLRAGGPVA
jgi:hypothetical protein